MNPTAEDILNTPFKKFILEKAFYEPLTEKEAEIAINVLSPAVFIKYAEEYSLLKSKEAADKAWEAGSKRARWEYDMALRIGDKYTAVDKETFMKELFKPVTI